MNFVTAPARAALDKPEVRKLIVIALATGGISSAAAAYLVSHIDPSTSVKKEVRTAILFGTLSTLLSIGYKVYKADKHAGNRA